MFAQRYVNNFKSFAILVFYISPIEVITPHERVAASGHQAARSESSALSKRGWDVRLALPFDCLLCLLRWGQRLVEPISARAKTFWPGGSNPAEKAKLSRRLRIDTFNKDLNCFVAWSQQDFPKVSRKIAWCVSY